MAKRIRDLLTPPAPPSPSSPKPERPRLSLRALILEFLDDKEDWSFCLAEIGAGIQPKLQSRVERGDPRIMFGPTAALFEETRAHGTALMPMTQMVSPTLELLVAEGIVAKVESDDDWYFFLARLAQGDEAEDAQSGQLT